MYNDGLLKLLILNLALDIFCFQQRCMYFKLTPC